MTTALDLIEETRRYLFAGQRENLNALNADIDETATTLAFARDLNILKAGSYVSIDLEIVYVWETAEAGKTAIVERGMLGSTAATHTTGTLAYVNSKFPTHAIFQALNADLNDLSSPGNGLFGLSTLQFNFNPAIQAYDLADTSTILDVLRVRYKQPGPWKNWIELRSWAFKRDADTTIFPSGNSLTLYDSAWAGLPVEVIYSAPFTVFTDTDTDITDVGLPESMADIPPLGAAMRLAGVRETQRNFNESQGDTRRAAETPPGAQIQGMRALAQLRQTRIKAEAGKLSSSYPIRRQR